MNKPWRSLSVLAASVAAIGVTTAVHLHRTDSGADGPLSPAAIGEQELFRGVVFGQGALAQELGRQPSLADFYRAGYVVNNSPDQLAAADDIVQQIAQKDPAYFTTFANSVRSGNPYVVSQAVDGVEAEFQRVGVRSTNDGSTSPVVPAPAASVRPRTGGVHINYNYNFNVHTNVNAVINENVAVNINVFKTPRRAASQPAGFQQELMIGELASVLKA